MIVAQARLPCFYRDYAVPDTVNGRFDLIVLHLALVLDRLMADPAQREAGQWLFDHFCTDMDSNLREIGISDLKVPREMRRMGEAFYGRAQAYQAALAEEGDEALIEAVARNIYGVTPPGPAAAGRLAAYMREAVREVAAQDPAALAEGALRLPDPAAIPAVAV
jgi:cytochrome b pre-mRNA-processing protein 3